jgi:hypothetical protein
VATAAGVGSTDFITGSTGFADGSTTGIDVPRTASRIRLTWLASTLRGERACMLMTQNLLEKLRQFSRGLSGAFVLLVVHPVNCRAMRRRHRQTRLPPLRGGEHDAGQVGDEVAPHQQEPEEQARGRGHRGCPGTRTAMSATAEEPRDHRGRHGPKFSPVAHSERAQHRGGVGYAEADGRRRQAPRFEQVSLELDEQRPRSHRAGRPIPIASRIRFIAARTPLTFRIKCGAQRQEGR